MKLMEIKRGESRINFQCKNGDVYDSSAVLSENGHVFYQSDYWNTAHTMNYNGGILVLGTYYGVCDMAHFDYKPNPVKIIRVFRLTDNMTEVNLPAVDNIPLAAFRLPSIVPNPNQSGEKYMDYILLHEGGYKWNYSHGCITALNYSEDDKIHEFDRFINNLTIGEHIKIILS